MNEKVPIVQPVAKKLTKSPKNRQITTEDPFLNENKGNNDNLLKDNTSIPQISREDFHVAGWHGRSRIPSPHRTISPKKNDIKQIPKDDLSNQDLDSLSEPGYNKRPRISNNTIKKPHKDLNQAQDDSCINDDHRENNDILRITAINGKSEKKHVSKAESARELHPRRVSTLKPSQKNTFENYGDPTLGTSQVVSPREPVGRNKSPRKVVREPKISVRSEVEQRYENEMDSFSKSKPFYELFRRKDILVQIARVFFPDSQTDEEAILNLINHNKDCIELNEVNRVLKDDETKNRDLLLSPFRNSKIRFNGKQQREAENLVNEIFNSRKQIAKLKLFTMNPTNSSLYNTSDLSRTVYNPQEDMGYEKIDQQVSFTKEKNFIRALENEVARLEGELASVEKRIKLMTQRKSAYAGLHAERISDQYGKQMIDIPRLGEDTEEDMLDNGIFKMTVTYYNENEEELEDEIDCNVKK